MKNSNTENQIENISSVERKSNQRIIENTLKNLRNHLSSLKINGALGEEIISEYSLALAEKLNASKKIRERFAVGIIALTDKVLTENSDLNMPSQIFQIIKSIKNAIIILEQKLEREPSDSEIASHLKMPPNTIGHYKRVMNNMTFISFDELNGFVSENEGLDIEEELIIENTEIEEQEEPNEEDLMPKETIADIINKFTDDDDTKNPGDMVPDTDSKIDPLNNIINESLHKDIERVLKSLTERQQEIIRFYFGINDNNQLTLEEIGDKMELDRERIRQIKEKAIRRMQHDQRSRVLKDYL